MRTIAKRLGVLLLLCVLFVGEGFAQSTITMSAANVSAVPGQTATVHINVTNFNNIGAITLVLTYDAEVLTFESLDNTPRVFTTTTPSPGELRITWFDGSTNNPINLGDGKLGDLRFMFDGEFSNVAFDAGQSEIADSEASVLEVAYTNGSVTAADVGDPTATTNPATAIAAESATLNGTVNPGAGVAVVTFEYRAVGTDLVETVTANQSPVSGTEDVPVSAEVAGLEPETEYAFRIIAENSAGVAQGNEQIFATGSAALTVSPEEVAFGGVAIGETEQATVTIANEGNSSLTIQGVSLSGAADFSIAGDTGELALNPGQTRTVTIAFAPQSQGEKNADLLVQSADDERVVAVSGTGQIAAPTATTTAATEVTARSAVLNGTVNSGGGEASVSFAYSATGSDAVQTISADPGLVSGTEPVAVSAMADDLTPGTEYIFRVVAENSGGSTSGANESFVTPIATPVATTQAATGVSVERAVLNGAVNPGGGETTVNFEYRLAGSDDVQSVPAAQSLVNGADPVLVSAEVPGLQPETEYAFRVVAENEAGSASSDEATFVTQPPALTARLPLPRATCGGA